MCPVPLYQAEVQTGINASECVWGCSMGVSVRDRIRDFDDEKD